MGLDRSAERNNTQNQQRRGAPCTPWRRWQRRRKGKQTGNRTKITQNDKNHPRTGKIRFREQCSSFEEKQTKKHTKRKRQFTRTKEKKEQKKKCAIRP
jgi:hypothetical protein